MLYDIIFIRTAAIRSSTAVVTPRIIAPDAWPRIHYHPLYMILVSFVHIMCVPWGKRLIFTNDISDRTTVERFSMIFLSHRTLYPQRFTVILLFILSYWIEATSAHVYTCILNDSHTRRMEPISSSLSSLFMLKIYLNSEKAEPTERKANKTMIHTFFFFLVLINLIPIWYIFLNYVFV